MATKPEIQPNHAENAADQPDHHTFPRFSIDTLRLAASGSNGMLTVPPELEELYDGDGRHLGGVYPPLMVNRTLTPEYAIKTAARPVCRHVHGLAGPAERLGLVWMLPVPSNPLSLSPQTWAALVHTLDQGQSVVMHADSNEALNAADYWISLVLGGGHA